MILVTGTDSPLVRVLKGRCQQFYSLDETGWNPDYQCSSSSLQAQMIAGSTLNPEEPEREYIQPEFYGTFILADRFPTLERSIYLHLPEDRHILYGLTATEGLDVHTEKSKTESLATFQVTAANLASFTDKSMTPYPEEYYAALHVSFPPKGNSSYTWEELGDHYLRLSKEAFEITDSIQELSDSVILKEGEDPVPYMFDEVVQRLRYHGDWNGRFAFFPREAKVILENGYGDCKELATILKKLLSSKNRETHFVLLSTWNNFQAIDEYPSLDYFNHTILAVPYGDDNYFFLDPTHTWADSQTSHESTGVVTNRT